MVTMVALVWLPETYFFSEFTKIRLFFGNSMHHVQP